MNRMDCAILAGGDFGEAEAALFRSFSEGSYLIAADRGLESALRYGLRPDVVIGDFDSISPGVLDGFEGRLIRLNPVKDDTDTEAALHLALEETEGRIFIWGGFGSRMDHVLANIHILRIAAHVGREAFLMNACNRIRILKGSLVLERAQQFGRYVSFFPLTSVVEGLRLEGFAYPLANASLAIGSSLGTSNELLEEQGRISFAKGELVMIESRDAAGGSANRNTH